MFTINLLLVIFTLAGAIDPHQSFKVTQIPARAGVYYDKLNPLRISSTEWRLVTAIDIDELLKGRPQVSSFCDHRGSNLIGICEVDSEFGHSLRTSFNKTQRYFDILRERIYHTDTSKAKRAAPLGFIGSLSHSLFGTLTEEDAERFNEEIDKVYSSQKDLATLIGNQSHIMRSEFSSIHEELLMKDKSIKRIAERTKILFSNEEVIESQLAIYERNQLLNKWEQSSIRYFDEYYETLVLLTDAILFAQDGNLHPSVIAPKRILQAIQDIRASSNLEIPFSDKEILAESFGKAINLKVRYQQGRILFVLRIPLLELPTWDLYQIVPFPSIRPLSGNHSFATFIQPAFPYLCISRDRQLYFLMNEDQLQRCKLLHHHYICEGSHPRYTTLKNPRCEIQLLLTPTKTNLKTCQVHIIPEFKSVWKKLHTPGYWIFSLASETEIQIFCNHQLRNIEHLSDVGIIHLLPGCKATTPEMEITSSAILDSSEPVIYHPEIQLDLSAIMPNVSVHHLEALRDLTESRPANHSSWEHSQNSLALQDIENRAKILQTVHRERTWTRTATYSGCGIFTLLIVIGLSYVIIRRCLLKRSVSLRRHVYATPGPRSPKIRELQPMVPISLSNRQPATQAPEPVIYVRRSLPAILPPPEDPTSASRFSLPMI